MSVLDHKESSHYATFGDTACLVDNGTRNRRYSSQGGNSRPSNAAL